jgi:glycine/D-amino acid oxidase-like deaminating enzyme/nitrite reductase/ring-hydroxylating ferredoxin subunit
MWSHTSSRPSFPRLNEDIECDVAVIGGGITGIMTAYVLLEAGVKIAIIDAGQILQSTTSFTTAKVTSQHGMIYNSLLSHFGKEAARLYYEANEEAIRFISDTIQKHNIECQFQREDAYLYADSEEQLNQLRQEWEAYRQLDLPGEWIDELPLQIESKGAIVLHNQAHFHPLQYLSALTNYIVEKGGRFYEHTTLEDYAEEQDDGNIILKTADGYKVACKYAVSASHFPFFDGGGLYFTRLHAERSYVIAIKPQKTYPGGMYINCGEPKRSIRPAMLNESEVLLVGGESHRTGTNDCTIERYEKLEQFARDNLGVEQIPYRWSTQDLITIDEVPYIGNVTSNHPRVYVATGFAKWGMTTSVVSATLIADLIAGKENRYTELFTPSRFKLNPGLKNITVQNAEVAKELISGKIEAVHLKVEDLRTDQGAIVKHRGKRAGAYKDTTGVVHLVDTTCSHMGCEVNWNEAERTWDCPCHGSRFSYKGTVIEGPATEDLTRLNPHYGAEK